MRIIRWLFTMLWVGFILAMAGAVVGALAARQRVVPAPAPDADEIELLATFEPLHYQSRASGFRGGTIECWYGGGVVDLREAVLDPAGARLEVRTVFGGGQLIVPETWNVVSHVKGIGGVADTRPATERALDAPQLTIEGVVMFGGLAVMSDVPEDELRGLDEQIQRWARHGRTAEAEAPIEAAAPIEASLPAEPAQPTIEPAG